MMGGGWNGRGGAPDPGEGAAFLHSLALAPSAEAQGALKGVWR